VIMWNAPSYRPQFTQT